MVLKSTSPQQTFRLGYKIGKKLAPAAVICLIGPLGSGKTTFVQGVTSGLRTKPKATSPSFRLINEYSGFLPVYHFDLYRLGNIKDLENLGYSEYFYGQGITIIEWAEKIKSSWPDENLRIDFQYLDSSSRRIELIAHGKAYQNILREIQSLR